MPARMKKSPLLNILPPIGNAPPSAGSPAPHTHNIKPVSPPSQLPLRNPMVFFFRSVAPPTPPVGSTVLLRW